MIHHRVGIDNGHRGHPVKIKTFCHHLRTYQNVSFPLREISDYILVTILVTGRVEIHTQRPGSVERLSNLVGHALSPVAVGLYRRLMTCRTLHRLGIHSSAVMTHEPVDPFVICQRDVAMFALRCVATHLAHGHRSITPAVEKHYGLFAVIHSLMHQIDCLLRQCPAHRLAFARQGGVYYPDLR